MKEKLISLFAPKIKNGKINPNAIKQVLNENNWIYDEYYKEYENQKDYYSSFGKFLIALVKDIQLNHCKACGKILTYDQTVGGATYCSNKCKLSNGENPFSRADIKEKIKQKIIEKYGVDNVAKSNEIKNKMKNTCIRKYGVKNGGGSKETLEKVKKTQLSKYGKWYSQTDEYKNKVKNTNIERYGVVHKNILNAWNKIINCEKAEPLFTLDEFKVSDHKHDFLKWKCKFCGNEFYSRWDNGGMINKCQCQFKNANVNGSTYEHELLDFLRQFNFKIVPHFKLPHNFEIDIYLPEIKLGIEFNGIYWHSIENRHGDNYHLNKLLKAEENGIHLIQIWEDEWKSDKENVKEKIKDIIFNKPIHFTDEVVKLDRCWFSKLKDIENYELIQEEPPEILTKKNIKVENCGYLIYKKKGL